MLSSAPSGAPFSRNCTPTTPMLSLLALAVTLIVPDTVLPAAGAVRGEWVGGVTSGGGATTVTVTPADGVSRLPVCRSRGSAASPIPATVGVHW